MDSISIWSDTVAQQINSGRNCIEWEDGFDERMQTLRAFAENRLDLLLIESTQLCREIPYRHHVIHDYGTGWVGPLTGNTERIASPVTVSFPGIQRRDDGYWFEIKPLPTKTNRQEPGQPGAEPARPRRGARS